MTLDERFELLRARVESAVPLPAVVVISSACAGDGKSVTAFGLAESLTIAGYRTVLIDANDGVAAHSDAPGPLNLQQFVDRGPRSFAQTHTDGGFELIALTKESLRRSASRRDVESALDACRDAYDVAIVDAGRLLESNLAMLFAEHAQALLLTVREGRGVKRADRDLVRALANERFALLGTVSVSSATIRDFGRGSVRRGVAVTSIAHVENAPRRQRAAG